MKRILLILLLILMPGAAVSAELQRVPAVIHLDSYIGGGTLIPELIVKKAREAGIKVAIFNDKDSNRIEYGLFPLRNLVRKVVEKESLTHYGAEKYIERINKIDDLNPDMVIIHGTETIPFYYWEGDPFSGLTLKNFHKNLLVIGLTTAEDYKNLPSVPRKKPRLFSAMCLLNLWPVPVIVLAVVAFRIKRRSIDYINNRVVERDRRPLKIPGILLGIIGLVFLINNFPFCPPKFDPYHGDKGSEPYQFQIDYVNSKGGLTFWSSPDIETSKFKIGPVTFETPPYFHDLLETRNYTGFAVFAEGMKHTGIPGGIWDIILKQYINGERERPVWAIGELDYEEGDWMGETQTILLLRELSREEVLNALRTGRCYAVMGPADRPKPFIENFQVWDDLEQRWVEMGETASVTRSTRVRIKLINPDSRENNLLKVIREGEVIKTIKFRDSLSEVLQFEFSKPGGMTYYRLDLNSLLVSNPIFIRFKNPGMS